MMNMQKWQLNNVLSGLVCRFVMKSCHSRRVVNKLKGKGLFSSKYKYALIVNGGNRG